MSGGERFKGGALALGVMLAGAAAGVAAEELLYRRVLGQRNAGRDEPLGDLRGRRIDLTAGDGVRLAVQTWGPDDAPACVFVHGFLNSRVVWHYQIERLLRVANLRVVAYDARGHGQSSASWSPGRPVTAEVLGRDLLAVLDGADIEHAVLAGHSMGGMTVLQLAADAPHEIGARVRGLVLVNTTPAGITSPWKRRARTPRARPYSEGLLPRAFADPRRTKYITLRNNDLTTFIARAGFGADPSPAHVAMTARMLSSTPPETLAASVGLLDYDVTATLSAIDVPVLVIAGARDVLTPASVSRRIASAISGARLEVFPRAGHMCPLERHDEVGGMIEEFLREHLLCGETPG